MAYDADPAATFDPTVGGTPTAAWLDIFNANFAHLGAAWTTFTPGVTNITVGNGTLAAAYRLVGKTLDFRIYLLFGSTTTLAADPKFGLPASKTGVAAAPQIVLARAEDASPAGNYTGTGHIAASGTTIEFLNFAGGTGTASATVPFTWTTSDVLKINGTIEVA